MLPKKIWKKQLYLGFQKLYEYNVFKLIRWNCYWLKCFQLCSISNNIELKKLQYCSGFFLLFTWLCFVITFKRNVSTSIYFCGGWRRLRERTWGQELSRNWAVKKWVRLDGLELRVHSPQFTILNSYDQLPSGLVAQLVEQRWSVPEVVDSNPTGVRDFFSFSVWAHFLSRANAQKVLFGIFSRALTLITFKRIYMN